METAGTGSGGRGADLEQRHVVLTPAVELAEQVVAELLWRHRLATLEDAEEQVQALLEGYTAALDQASV